MSIVSEVKQRTDIVEIIGQYTTLTKAGRMFRGICPFHSEKHGSFFVYPEQQSWHCFGACNTGGDVFSFLMKKQGLSFNEALKMLADRAHIAVPSRFESEPGRNLKDRLYQTNEAAAEFYNKFLIESKNGEKVRNYLENRGFTKDTIANFRLGYSPNEWEALKKHLSTLGFTETEMLTAGLIIKRDDGTTHDRFRNRIMFPIHDIKGRTTGFGGRVLDNAVPKYLNSPQTPVFDKGGTLYGIDFAFDAVRQNDMIIIVEGYADVIMAHQYGFNNVVASMGTAISASHVSIFKNYTHNMVLALDPDTAGQEAMKRGVEYENMLDTEVKVMVLPEGKDPDEMIKENPEEWRSLVNSAVPVRDFIINGAIRNLDLKESKNQKSVLETLLPLILDLQDDQKRDRFLRRLSQIMEVEYKTLERALVRSIPERKVMESPNDSLSRAVRNVTSNPTEEYCLALLLQHPEIRDLAAALTPELFENTENRVIFETWRNSDNITRLREVLGEAILEQFDYLCQKKYMDTAIEEKFIDLSTNLAEKYIRNLARQREIMESAIAEADGMEASLQKVIEQGLEVPNQLKELFKRSRKGNRLQNKNSFSTRRN